MGRKKSWIQENTWVCPYCMSTQLGRFNSCQVCKAVKGKKVVDIVPAPNQAKAIVEKPLLEIATGGADWHCEFCDSKVRNAKGECQNCSAPKEEPAPPTVVEEVAVPKPTTTVNPPRTRHVVNTGHPPTESTAVPLLLFIVGASILTLLIFGLSSREVEAKVNSIGWEHKSVLRQRISEKGADWAPLPSGAFDTSCTNKLYGHEDCHCRDIPDGYKTEYYDCNPYDCNCRQSCRDNGNGFSTCSESCGTCYRTCSKSVQEYRRQCDECPVYRDYCTYSYYEWPVVSTKVTSGTRHNEHWPDLKAFGQEQRLETTEEYRVVFLTDKGESIKFAPVSLDDFKRFEVEERWNLSVSPITGVDRSKMTKVK